MEKDTTYKFNFSRRVIYLTLLHIVVSVLFAYLLYIFYEGGYLSAWFASFVVALICLLTLSIPRRVVVSQSQVKIICILELTEIDIADIVKVRKVNPRNLKWIIPLFGGYGFFGYYGLFFDLRRAERIKMYATEWQYLVEIVDIYEDRYYISCRDREKFVKDIQHRRCENDKLRAL
ncbi:MAG: PH domain-containing protein [Rikenellaceae bacterium]